MTRLGITGHQSIPAAAREFVSNALEVEIRRNSGDGTVWGVSSLAIGADQLFANLVLRAGGRLHAILPCENYEKTFAPGALKEFQKLLTMATTIERLAFPEPSEEAFLTAGRRVVEACDLLLAVWDGKASRGLGGTGDIVEYARSAGTSLRVVWPTGVSR